MTIFRKEIYERQRTVKNGRWISQGPDTDDPDGKDYLEDDIWSKYEELYGEEFVDYFKPFGEDGKKILEQYGDDLLDVFDNLSEEDIKKAIELANEYGDEAVELLKKGKNVDNIKGILGDVNSYVDFNRLVTDIGKRSDLTDAQKIIALQEIFEYSNYKIDINVPSDIQYIKGFDANGYVIYDWPPKLGFDESTIQSISRTNGLPDTWDRYGYMGGSNFADVPSTGKYTYSERAIPYMENEAAYHTGTFNNATYFDKIDAIRNGDIEALNNILYSEGIDIVDLSYFENLQISYNDFIERTIESVGENIDATYGLKGYAASWGDMTGGAGQYVTPLNGTTMSRLGIIK